MDPETYSALVSEVQNTFWMRMGIPRIGYVLPVVHAHVSGRHCAHYLHSQRVGHLHRLNSILEGSFLATDKVM